LKYSQFSLESLAKIGLTLQVIKTALAAGVSYGLALFLSDNPYPIFAPLAAILTIQVTIADSIQKGLYRTLGVIIGVGIGNLIGHFFVISGISILIAILLAFSLSTAFQLNQQIISQVGVSALLVLGYGQEHGYMLGRIVETIVGALTAVIINMVISPPNASAALKQGILQLSRRLSDSLYGMEGCSEQEKLSSDLKKARELVQQTEKECENLLLSLNSLHYTPFRQQERRKVEELASILNRMERMTIQVRGIARSLYDLRIAKGYCLNFNEVLQATAKCIAIFGELSVSPSPELESLLAKSLAEARNSQIKNFLEMRRLTLTDFVPEIGGLFTDLVRILDEIEDKFPN